MDEEYEGGMTDAQLAVFLKLLADLIDATAKTVPDATAILRDKAAFLLQYGRRD